MSLRYKFGYDVTLMIVIQYGIFASESQLKNVMYSLYHRSCHVMIIMKPSSKTICCLQQHAEKSVHGLFNKLQLVLISERKDQ